MLNLADLADIALENPDAVQCEKEPQQDQGVWDGAEVVQAQADAAGQTTS